MTWTNAFDLGDCALAVHRAGTLYWTGTLAKGASSPSFLGYYGDQETLQVQVSADGTVALVALDATTNTADGYELSVIPSYDLTGGSFRVSGLSLASDATYAAQAWSNPANPVALTPPTDWQHWVPTAVTPDPADITDAAGTALTVNMGAGV